MKIVPIILGRAVQLCFWDDDMNLCNTRSSDDLCSLAPSREICVLYKETCYWDNSRSSMRAKALNFVY